MEKDPFKVLIVGTGPGGLALAQILRGHDIPFEIFERDESIESRDQGWAMSLVECLSDLESLLPGDLGDVEQISVNRKTGNKDFGSLVDANGRTLAVFGGGQRGDPGFVLRADRSEMRRYFWQKLDVRTNKSFTHFVEDDTGVTAFFADGSRTRGTILVGADGANSRIRSQLLGPNVGSVTESRYVPFVGQGELPRHVFAPLYRRYSVGVMSAAGGMRLFIGLKSIEADLSSAVYYYIAARMVDDPVQENAWAQTASAQCLYRHTLEMIRNAPSWVTNIIRHIGEEGVVTPPFKFVEFVPPKSLPRGHVTLMGDAAHTMVPFNGAGANNALQDACDLARVLIGRSANDTTDRLLQRYAEAMIPRGRNAVISSRAAGEQDDNVSPLLRERMSARERGMAKNTNVVA